MDVPGEYDPWGGGLGPGTPDSLITSSRVLKDELAVHVDRAGDADADRCMSRRPSDDNFTGEVARAINVHDERVGIVHARMSRRNAHSSQ